MIWLLIATSVLGSVICGTIEPLHSKSRRLVGGVPVNVSSYPFMASLQYYDKHLCGATVHSKNTILTAALCVVAKWYKKLSVRLGSSHHNRGGYVYRVAKVAYPKNFGILMGHNDLALLKLEVSIDFEKLNHVSTVNLLGMNESIPSDTEAFMVGWGNITSNGSALSDQLNRESVKTISINQCAKEMDLEPESMINTICTHGLDRKTCGRGGSGGPLMLNGRQVGVIARGGCTAPFLQMNTQISLFHNWFDKNVKELNDPNRPPIVKHPVIEEELRYNHYSQGVEKDIARVPFLVAILDPRGAIVCSGSIIDPVHVLTSASCTQRINTTHYAVLAGSSNLKDGGTMHHIVDMIPHAEYKMDEFGRPINDLALIEVSTAFASTLGTVKLFPGGYFDSYATVYGWGEIDPSLRKSEEIEYRLKSLRVSVESGNKECGILSDEISQDENRFCSSNLNDEGACISNRGGPLKMGSYLIGIVSWVYDDCGDYWYPTIYTKIAPYRAWISERITKPNGSTP